MGKRQDSRVRKIALYMDGKSREVRPSPRSAYLWRLEAGWAKEGLWRVMDPSASLFDYVEG